MKIVSFEREDGTGLGLIESDAIVDLSAVDARAPRDLRLVLEDDGLAQLANLARGAPRASFLPLNGIRYARPVVGARKMFCLGLNYARHVDEGPFDRQSYPTLFMRVETSLTAHESPILRRWCSETLDWEAELAVVIGRRAKHVPVEDALAVVAGYMCHNDVSVRDFQRHTLQWTMGKNFDGTGRWDPVSSPRTNCRPAARDWASRRA